MPFCAWERRHCRLADGARSRCPAPTQESEQQPTPGVALHCVKMLQDRRVLREAVPGAARRGVPMGTAKRRAP
eukprot:11196730-Lingulodinium_polyedra.AAC.1